MAGSSQLSNDSWPSTGTSILPEPRLLRQRVRLCLAPHCKSKAIATRVHTSGAASSRRMFPGFTESTVKEFFSRAGPLLLN
jgi:hypothetical protein